MMLDFTMGTAHIWVRLMIKMLHILKSLHFVFDKDDKRIYSSSKADILIRAKVHMNFITGQ